MTIQGLDNTLILDASNNNIVTFEATGVGTVKKASIQLNGYEFLITPINDSFTFNFKEIFRTLSDSNALDFKRTAPIVSNDGIVFSSEVTTTITFDDNTTEQDVTTYYYTRSVEQIGRYIGRSVSKQNVLSPTVLKAWKGYPFSVVVTTIGDTSLNVGGTNYATTGDAQEVVLCGYSALMKERLKYYEGCSNDKTDSILLDEGYNDVQVGGTTLSVQYIDKCDGVYLKWLNKKGGYSYWLFNGIYNDDLTTRTRDRFVDDFANLNEATRSFGITGKDSTKGRKLHTDVLSVSDVAQVEDLLDSPQVMLYNGLDASNVWQEVYLRDGTFNVASTKRNFVTLRVTIELNNYSL